MKIQVDTAVDSVPDIRNVVQLLVEHLAVRGGMPVLHPQAPNGPGLPLPPNMPTPVMLPPSQPIPPPPPVAAEVPPPPVPAVFSVPPPPPPADAAPSLSTAQTADSVNADTPSTEAAPPSAPMSASPSDGAVELDSAGLPWDPRIHSETRKQNADGTWRYRRNLSEEVKTATVSELRVRYPQAAAAIAPPPPPPPVAAPVIAPPPATVIPPPPPTGAVSPGQPVGVQPGAVQVAVTDFKSLMTKAGALMQAGKLTHPMLAQACIAAGVASLPALMGAPDKIPAVNAWLDEHVQA